MKTTLLLFSVLFLSFTTINSNPIDKLGVKGPLEFNKTRFNLAFANHPRANYYIQEYLPAGETVEKFNQMMSIHLFQTELETVDLVNHKIAELTERKKTDGVCNYEIIESPDGKEFILDFLLSETKGDEMTIVEFNVYHYKEIQVGDDQKAVVVYAYSKRSYGNKIIKFLKNLKDDRTTHLNQMIAAKMPEILLQEK